MDAYVWVEAWQQQCCGSDFQIGSTVQWQVRRADRQEWLERLLDTDWSTTVHYSEDHHLDNHNGTLTGVVADINVLTSDRVLGDAPGDVTGRAMVPVPGSGRLREVTVADRWQPPPPNGSFDGWIVRLESAVFTPLLHPRLRAGAKRTYG